MISYKRAGWALAVAALVAVWSHGSVDSAMLTCGSGGARDFNWTLSDDDLDLLGHGHDDPGLAWQLETPYWRIIWSEHHWELVEGEHVVPENDVHYICGED